METRSVGVERGARNHASLRRHDDEELHTVVFSGFAAKSRKKRLVDHVKLQLPVVERLAGHADVLDIGEKVIAPGKRTSVAMTRFPTKAALFKFLSAWKEADEAGWRDSCARLRGRDQETVVHGCMAEIRRLLCTVAWPRSGDCCARLHGRDREAELCGYVAEIRRLLCAVAWP